MYQVFRSDLLRTTMRNLHLQIRDAGYALLDEKWGGFMNGCSYTHIYYIIKGTASFTSLDGVKHFMTEGNCYLMPASYNYSYALETSFEHLFFNVKLCSMDGIDLLKECKKPLSYAFPKKKLPLYLAYTASSDLLDGLLMKQELYESILTMLQKYNISLQPRVYSELIKRVIIYVRNNPSIKLTANDIADQMFVSASTLNKKFKEETDMTLGKYINMSIMSEAEKLLINANTSLQEISEELGFCDQSYFGRWFKYRFGVTPMQYRQRF